METIGQLDDFIDAFLEFENRYNLFDVKINKVRVWNYLRLHVYNDLLKIKGFRDGKCREKTRTKENKKTLEFKWKKYVSCNELFAHQRDVLIISHGRKYKDGDKYYKCPYTHLLDGYLSNSHYILDRKTPDGNYELQKSHNILYSDIETFKKIMHVFFPYEMALRSEIDTKIMEPIETQFGLCISTEIKKNWTRCINDYINIRKEYITYYNYILARIKPKIILIVCAYAVDGMFLCEAAHKRHIPVVELQHGWMGDEHIAYNFKTKMRLSTFPDYFFSFGRFEKELTRFPIPKSHIIPVGYPELESKHTTYKAKRGDKKVILFISALSTTTAKFADAVAKMLDENKYQVVVQLHPFEYSCWKETIGKYLTHPAIKVVGSYEHSVYESLAQADWVVGNYSTVLSEAQMFDVKVAVMKFEKYQAVKFLYQNDYAVLVDSPKQLVKEIETDTFQPNRAVSLFERNSLENMQKSIDEIIKTTERR